MAAEVVVAQDPILRTSRYHQTGVRGEIFVEDVVRFPPPIGRVISADLFVSDDHSVAPVFRHLNDEQFGTRSGIGGVGYETIGSVNSTT